MIEELVRVGGPWPRARPSRRRGGIQDAATLDLLRQLKCDFSQGYFISRPVPADEIFFGVDVQELAPSGPPMGTTSTR
jgi:predicted signal transduction protein with EAL and GGDEF domain